MNSLSTDEETLSRMIKGIKSTKTLLLYNQSQLSDLAKLVCNKLGMLPQDLVIKKLSDFEDKNVPEFIQKIRFQHYEKRRRSLFHIEKRNKIKEYILKIKRLAKDSRRNSFSSAEDFINSDYSSNLQNLQNIKGTLKNISIFNRNPQFNFINTHQRQKNNYLRSREIYQQKIKYFQEKIDRQDSKFRKSLEVHSGSNKSSKTKFNFHYSISYQKNNKMDHSNDSDFIQESEKVYLI